MKIEEYYQNLLSIVRIKIPYINDLIVFPNGKNLVDLKDVIKKIIESGNEFILSDVYLYCIVSNSFSRSISLVELYKNLILFTRNNYDKLLDSVADLYCGLVTNFQGIKKVDDMIWNNEIPLIDDLLYSLCKLDQSRDVSEHDFLVIRDIYFLLVSYCIINHEEDNYIKYTHYFLDNPKLIIDQLLVNGIIRKLNDNNNYLINSDQLKKYVLYKLNNYTTKVIK